MMSDDTPIDMVLFCPACGTQHIDKALVETPDFDSMPDEPISGLIAPEDLIARHKQYDEWFAANWTNPPHRSHLCHNCGHVWRPADVPTNGVEKIETHGKDDSPLIHPWHLSPTQAADRKSRYAAAQPWLD